jgi:hypothetical protein
VIADYMLSVMHDEKARTADRLEAAKWLADRGFGRAMQTLDLDVTAHPPIDVTQLSTPDLEALIAIFERYRPNVADWLLRARSRSQRRRRVKSASRNAGGRSLSGPHTGPQTVEAAWLSETRRGVKTGEAWQPST